METIARPATATYHTLQANQLASAALLLRQQWRGGQLVAHQAYQRADSYMRQAQQLANAAYAAGRGYAATARATGCAYAISNEIATEAGATYYMAVRGGTPANPQAQQ